MPRRTTNRPLTVAALLLVLCMGAMEMTVVSTAMPTVIADVGGIGKYAWVFTAYMLGTTVMVPIYGKLADAHGRKPLILFGIALFLAGSMASGQARTMDQLILFRALQGVGAGAMQPIAFTIVGDIFDLEQRARMQGVFGGAWGVASIAGPLLGGLIVRAFGWRWVFYINVPFGILTALMLVLGLVETFERKPHRLDLLGSTLLAGSIVSILLAAQRIFPLVLAPVGVALGGAFIAAEAYAAEPLLPLDLFRNPAISVSSAASALRGATMVATVTFVPLFVQAVLGGTPAQAGAAIAPMLVGWPLASAVSGRLLKKVGFRPLIVIGLFVTAASSVFLALAVARGVLSLRVIQGGVGGFGVGLGISNTALLIAVQSSVGWEQRGVVTASTVFFRNVGATIGVGILGALLTAGLRRNAPGADAVVNQLLGHQRLDATNVAALRQVSFAFQRGLGIIFCCIAGLSSLNYVVGLWFPEVPTSPVDPRVDPRAERSRSLGR